MECLTGNYGLGTQDGRDSSLDWEIIQHPEKCEDNIDGEKIGDLVEGKAMPDRSCSILNNSDFELNIWDVFIFTCEIDPVSSWHVLVDHSLQWGKFYICMESCDVVSTLHVITVYLFEGLKYGLQFSFGQMIDICKAYLPAEGDK